MSTSAGSVEVDDEEIGESGDDAFPLISSPTPMMSAGTGGKSIINNNNNNNNNNNRQPPRRLGSAVADVNIYTKRQGRRQSVATMGQGSELSRQSEAAIDSSSTAAAAAANRATSLTRIGETPTMRKIGSAGNTTMMMALAQATSISSNLISGIGMTGSRGSLTNSKTDLLAEAPGNVDPQNPLYDTLLKSMSKRREQMARINSTTASLLMTVAPTVMAAPALPSSSGTEKQQQQTGSNKKSVCFADDVKPAASEGDEDYLDEVEFDEFGEEIIADDEEMEEEERRRRTLNRMRRRKETATKARMNKYGYDPLNPPIPRSWAEWSIQRRDYQAALAEVLQCQKLPQLSTAAMKGRKDSVAFVSEELLDFHLNKKQGESGLLSKIEKGDKDAKVAKKSRPQKGGPRNRQHQAQLLSDAELEILKAYYFHPLFSGSRVASFFCDLFAMSLILIAVAIPIWIKIPHKLEPLGPEYVYQLTMLQNCTVLLSAADDSLLANLRDFASDLKEAVDHRSVAVLTHSKQQVKQQVAVANKPIVGKQQYRSDVEMPLVSGGENDTDNNVISTSMTSTSFIEEAEATTSPLLFQFGNHTMDEFECEHYSFGSWHTFLIGVMGFALLLGLFGFFLGLCGACAGSLSNRLYYFHSTAEILFVSGVLTGLAVLFFPLCIRYKAEITTFSYGYGFYIGIVSAIDYLIAAALLNLDTFIMNTVPDDEKTKKRGKRRR